MKLTTVVAMLVAASAFGQVTERVDVNLVNVDVTVVDRSGKPVTDLNQNDFAVFEDGRQQKITHFARVAPGDAVRQRAIVIVIDQRIPADKLQRNQAIATLEKMVAESAEGSTWCVVTLDDPAGLKTIARPTADRKLAAAALESVRKGAEPPDQSGLAPAFDPNDDFECETADCIMRESERRIGESTAWFIAAANHAIRRVRQMPGSREILFVSDGSFYDPTLSQGIARDAAAANTRFFVLAPTGAGGGSSGYWLARETGGLYLGSNRVSDSVRIFDEATSNFYELAYVAGPDDGKYHRIDVKLLRPGRLTLLHRAGYLRVPRR